jgi:two-component system, response regulator PdtaR
MSLVPVSAIGDARARVLVVEGEALIRRDVSKALRAAGFVVIEAENADRAITFIEAGGSIDVMFTDVHLPGMLDGLALGNIMRAVRPSVPVIFTSDNLTKGTVAKRIGKFVPKPYEVREIVDLVAEVVLAANR